MPCYSRREALLVLLMASILALAIWPPYLLRPQRSDLRPQTVEQELGSEVPKALPSARISERLQGSIDLNQASREELQILPGIGPVLADRIARYRERFGPFQRPDDVKKVDGIGQKRFERIRDRIRVRDGRVR